MSRPTQPDARDGLPHPPQPVGKDSRGVARFKQNKIIRRMLDLGALGRKFVISDLTGDASDEDRMQLWQLLGYAVDTIKDLLNGSGASDAAAHERLQGAVLMAETGTKPAPNLLTKVTTFVGRPSGDCECFCFDTRLPETADLDEEFLHNKDFEEYVARQDEARIYPNDLLPKTESREEVLMGRWTVTATFEPMTEAELTASCRRYAKNKDGTPSSVELGPDDIQMGFCADGSPFIAGRDEPAEDYK